MSSCLSKPLRLRNGEIALVDADEFDRVSQYEWRRSSLGYAQRYLGNQRYQYLHRFILGEPSTEQQRRVIDHVNGDRLDNRKANLRIVDKATNSFNAGTSKRNTSGVRGVSRSGRLWRARIRRNGVNVELGAFADRNRAIAARRAAEA